MTRFVGLLATVLLVALCSSSASAQPVGAPFQVNTYTPGVQDAPSIAPLPAGGFVVVWESAGQDGDDLGIFGQRHSSNGARQGTEFAVNTFTTGPQGVPAVSSAADGSFVVVWQGYGDNSQDGDYSDIFARRYSNTGTPLGSQFEVNLPLVGFEGAAAVATTASGFVVVWDNYDDVMARRYDSAGMPQGLPFPVNTQTASFQGTASVAATTDGGFVIAWEGDVAGDGTDYDVFARRFNSSGAALGTEFQVNTATIGYQYAPAIAATLSGGFVVVWSSYPNIGSYRSIFGQRFNGAGALLGSEFPVESADGTDAGEPHVGADQSGNFVVVWSSATPVEAPLAVLSRRYTAAGVPLDSVAPVDNPGSNAFQPAVEVAPDGRHVVAWRRDG